MKKLITLFCIVMVQSMTFAQTQAASPAVSLIYSEEEEALIVKTDAAKHSNDIVIESLPGFGKDPVPVEISQNEKGYYTFKKHPSLTIPDYYTVIITDTLTGSQFDLKAADSYSFTVAKDMPERFLLQMSKNKTKLTAMR